MENVSLLLLDSRVDVLNICSSFLVAGYGKEGSARGKVG